MRSFQQLSSNVLEQRSAFRIYRNGFSQSLVSRQLSRSIFRMRTMSHDWKSQPGIIDLAKKLQEPSRNWLPMLWLTANTIGRKPLSLWGLVASRFTIRWKNWACRRIAVHEWMKTDPALGFHSPPEWLTSLLSFQSNNLKWYFWAGKRIFVCLHDLKF